MGEIFESRIYGQFVDCGPTMNHRYAPVKRCIYCGRDDGPLGDEHIVPLAFGGQLILPRSSCRNCEKIINGQIEGPILQSEWGDFRIKHDFPTRNRQGRRSMSKLRSRDGSTMQIPIGKHSTPVPLYNFRDARILSGRPAREDDFTIAMLASKNDEKAMQTKYNQWDRTHAFKAMPIRFARWIAKIGYSYAIAELGGRLFLPLVTDVILGKSEDVLFVVGGSESPHKGTLSGTIELKTGFGIEVRTTQYGMGLVGLLIVNVQLLAPLAIPAYHAVVGIIDFTNPQHCQEFEKFRNQNRWQQLGVGGI